MRLANNHTRVVGEYTLPKSSLLRALLDAYGLKLLSIVDSGCCRDGSGQSTSDVLEIYSIRTSDEANVFVGDHPNDPSCLFGTCIFGPWIRTPSRKEIEDELLQKLNGAYLIFKEFSSRDKTLAIIHCLKWKNENELRLKLMVGGWM